MFKAITNRIRFSVVSHFDILFKVKMILNPRYCVVNDHFVSRRNVVAEFDNNYCCRDCALDHNGRGKFEAYSDSGDDPDLQPLGIALILYSLAMSGMADDSCGNEWEHLDRIENFLLFSDSQGFVRFDEFDSAAKAETDFDSYYSDGLGANEDDAYVSFERGEWNASFAGKHLGSYPRESRAKAAISLEMRKSGYYPNVWYSDQGGGISLISVW
jgi:hypothetical protein